MNEKNLEKLSYLKAYKELTHAVKSSKQIYDYKESI